MFVYPDARRLGYYLLITIGIISSRYHLEFSTLIYTKSTIGLRMSRGGALSLAATSLGSVPAGRVWQSISYFTCIVIYQLLFKSSDSAGPNRNQKTTTVAEFSNAIACYHRRQLKNMISSRALGFVCGRPAERRRQADGKTIVSIVLHTINVPKE